MLVDVRLDVFQEEPLVALGSLFCRGGARIIRNDAAITGHRLIELTEGLVAFCHQERLRGELSFRRRESWRRPPGRGSGPSHASAPFLECVARGLGAWFDKTVMPLGDGREQL